MMKMTLPRPALIDLEMPWVVTVGTLGMRNAFAQHWHAVRFAKDIASDGTPVGLGHAKHGWNDMFDPHADDAETQTLAWYDSMKEEA